MSAVFDWVVRKTFESPGLRGNTKTLFSVSPFRLVPWIFRQSEESRND